jgi:cytochrome c oxidase assembly factor CtaG
MSLSHPYEVNLMTWNTIFWIHYITYTTNIAKRLNNFLYLLDAYVMATEIHDEEQEIKKTAKTLSSLILI